MDEWSRGRQTDSFGNSRGGRGMSGCGLADMGAGFLGAMAKIARIKRRETEAAQVAVQGDGRGLPMY